MSIHESQAERRPSRIFTREIRIEEYSSFEELPEDERLLLQSAREALPMAHSPYSDFMVAAALQLNDGEIITGNNVENAAYGDTICAERSALVKANSMGRKRDINKIAVIGTGGNFDTESPVTPCGSCRQVMNEFEQLSGKPFTIIMSGAKGPIYRMEGIESLLPFGFGPKDLGLA